MSSDNDHLAILNDDLRQHLYDRGILLTPGVAVLGEEAIARLAEATTAFDDFHDGSQSEQSYKFGVLDLNGTPVVFKFDYYKDRNSHSTDLASAATERIITIMLANES
jgi:hypothetical protein